MLRVNSRKPDAYILNAVAQISSEVRYECKWDLPSVNDCEGTLPTIFLEYVECFSFLHLSWLLGFRRLPVLLCLFYGSNFHVFIAFLWPIERPLGAISGSVSPQRLSHKNSQQWRTKIHQEIQPITTRSDRCWPTSLPDYPTLTLALQFSKCLDLYRIQEDPSSVGEPIILSFLSLGTHMRSKCLCLLGL